MTDVTKIHESLIKKATSYPVMVTRFRVEEDSIVYAVTPTSGNMSRRYNTLPYLVEDLNKNLSMEVVYAPARPGRGATESSVVITLKK